jgi:hypothetical protein
MTEVTQTTETEAPKTTKSIVPAKYSGRYKNGGEDELAQFIKAQCIVEGNFAFDRFFELMSKNGIADEKVNHYRGQVSEKRHGAEGRARMTLRNMLATIVRKNGKAIGLDNSEVAINLPKPALTGAAKVAADATSTTNPANPAAPTT